MKTLFSLCSQLQPIDIHKSKFCESMFPDSPTYREQNSNVYVSSDAGDAVIRCDNKDNIAKHYNKSIEYAIKEKYDIIIFCHDDIFIEDKFLAAKLERGLHANDIIGLAGAKTCTLREPVLWHLMSDRDSWSGAVAHPVSDKLVNVTSFGPSPERCIVMDGLFLAAKVESLLKSVTRFDESIPCIAHFYDIDFCLTANKNKLTMSTWPIWAVHSSSGLSKFTDEFKQGQEYILNKWKQHNQK